MKFILPVFLLFVAIIRSASSCTGGGYSKSPIGKEKCVMCQSCSDKLSSTIGYSRERCDNGLCVISQKVSLGRNPSLKGGEEYSHYSCTNKSMMASGESKSGKCLLSNYRPADTFFPEHDFLEPHEKQQFMTCYCQFTITDPQKGCPKSGSVGLKAEILSTLIGIGMLVFISSFL